MPLQVVSVGAETQMGFSTAITVPIIGSGDPGGIRTQ